MRGAGGRQLQSDGLGPVGRLMFRLIEARRALRWRARLSAVGWLEYTTASIVPNWWHLWVGSGSANRWWLVRPVGEIAFAVSNEQAALVFSEVAWRGVLDPEGAREALEQALLKAEEWAPATGASVRVLTATGSEGLPELEHIVTDEQRFWFGVDHAAAMGGRQPCRVSLDGVRKVSPLDLYYDEHGAYTPVFLNHLRDSLPPTAGLGVVGLLGRVDG